MRVRLEARVGYGKTLILCLSDDRLRLEARAALLKKHGYSVLAAADPRKGLDLLVRHAIDLVLLDEMRAINGDPVAARVKALKPKIPVLLLSARRGQPPHKPAFVDAFLSAEEPWANVLARVDELLAPDLPFFARWLGDWKRRRATVTPAETAEPSPSRKMEKRSA